MLFMLRWRRSSICPADVKLGFCQLLQAQYLEIGHDKFLPRPFRFIVNTFSSVLPVQWKRRCHMIESLVQFCVACTVEKALSYDRITCSL